MMFSGQMAIHEFWLETDVSGDFYESTLSDGRIIGESWTKGRLELPNNILEGKLISWQ